MGIIAAHMVFTTQRGVLVSCGFYDSKRSIGFVWFFFVVVVIPYLFTLGRAFSLEALYWRAQFCFFDILLYFV